MLGILLIEDFQLFFSFFLFLSNRFGRGDLEVITQESGKFRWKFIIVDKKNIKKIYGNIRVTRESYKFIKSRYIVVRKMV